ncbi:MAG: hypothetical protein HY974_04150 [Candidatus Kerfeldbacteria bacterium]|nr:hypothetical protein [Candidatus Kerfeldbacteria bacterium]
MYTEEVSTIEEALRRADRCLLVFEDPVEAAHYVDRAAEIAVLLELPTEEIANLYEESANYWADAARISLLLKPEALVATMVAAWWRQCARQERWDRRKNKARAVARNLGDTVRYPVQTLIYTYGLVEYTLHKWRRN